jgi:hypothetical protein
MAVPVAFAGDFESHATARVSANVLRLSAKSSDSNSFRLRATDTQPALAIPANLRHNKCLSRPRRILPEQGYICVNDSTIAHGCA